MKNKTSILRIVPVCFELLEFTDLDMDDEEVEINGKNNKNNLEDEEASAKRKSA